MKALPWVEGLAAGTLAVGLISLTLGLWPEFGFLSPLIVIVSSYGLVMTLNFVPAFGLLRPVGDLGTARPRLRTMPVAGRHKED